MIKQRYSLALFIMLALVFCGLAAAQSIGDLPTIAQIEGAAKGPPTDESIRFMSGIFGEDFAKNPFKTIGPSTTLLGSIVFLFNGALFVIGTSLVLYQFIMMIAVSANDGQPLGKNGESVIMPMRLGAGIFGMLPVFGGFSLAQAVMMFAITLGVGLANMLTDVIVEKTAQMQPFMPSISSMSNVQHDGIEDLARNLLVVQACHVALEHGSRAQYNNGQFSLAPKGGGFGFKYRDVEGFENRKARGLDFGPCGRVGVTKAQKSDLRLNEGKQAKLGYRIAAVDYAAIADSVNDAAFRELVDLSRDIRKSIERWSITIRSTGGLSEIGTVKAEFDELVATSKRRFQVAISEAGFGDNEAIDKEVQQSIKRGGWMRLGGWSSVFGEVSAALASAQSAYSFTFTAGPLINKAAEGIQPDSFYSPESITALFTEHFQSLSDESDNSSGYGKCYFVVQKNEVGECSPGQNIAATLITAVAGDSGGTGLVNPIIAAKNMGDYLMVVGQTIIGAQVVSSVATKNPALKMVTSAIGGNKFGEMSSTAAYLMIALGMYLSIFVPLHIFIAWFSAIISWAANMIEAVLMAQIAAFSHLKMDGQGMSDGPQRKGYVYLLHMALKPSLLVIGFVIANIILVFGGTFLFNTFIPAMHAAQGNSTTGPLTIVGYTFVICFTLFGLISTIANIMTKLPDTLVGWVGERAESIAGAAVIGGAAGSILAQAKGPSTSGVLQKAASSAPASASRDTGFSASTR